MQKLRNYDFADQPERTSYPWDEILCGQPIQLTEGEDFQCKPATFATLVRNAAKSRGLKVRTAKVEGGMVVQSYPDPDAANGSDQPTAPAAKKGGKKATATS